MVAWDRGEVVNLNGNVRFTPDRRYKPVSVEELVEIVREAESQGRSVRCAGSHWSFDETSLTRDWFVDTSVLSKFLGSTADAASDVLPAALLPAARARNLAHVQCGITVRDLYTKLDALNLALPTQGGSGGQTIAGAISTGTHGGDFERAPIPDAVRAIHLVGPGGIQHWLERGSDPIADARTLAARQPALAGHIHYDDDLFDAVLVSLGRMGIIYALILEAEPIYLLSETVERSTWAELKSNLLSEITPRPLRVRGVEVPELSQRHFDALFVAYDPFPCFLTRRATGVPPTRVWPVDVYGPASAGISQILCSLSDARHIVFPAVAAVGATAGAASAGAVAAAPLIDVFLPGLGGLIAGAVTAGSATATGASLAAMAKIAEGPRTFADLLVDVCNAATALRKPELVAALTGFVLTQARSRPVNGVRVGKSWRVMDGYDYSSKCDRGLSIEVVFDEIAAAVAYLDAIFEEIRRSFEEDNVPFGGYVALRVTRRTRALLGMQQSETSAHVEVSTLKGLKGNDELQRRFQRMALQLRGRLHWGQLNGWRAPDVHAAYRRLSTWRRALVTLSAGGSLRTFDSEYCQDRGLEPAGSAAACRLAANGFRWSSTTRADLCVWRPSDGTWYLRTTEQTPRDVRFQWGLEGDIPVAGSFVASGRSACAVWRSSDGTWWVLDPPTGNTRTVTWGEPGDIPVPAPYFVAGRTDFAIWRPSTGTWWILASAGEERRVEQFGLPGDIPVPFDMEGTGIANLAVFRPAEGRWYVRRRDGGETTFLLGKAGDIPVPAAYFGGGRQTPAVWRPIDGTWIIGSDSATARTETWGEPGDVPVPADYDGNGIAEPAVWRPATGEWWVRGRQAIQWGLPGDVPS